MKDNCPHCNASLIGDLIPEDMRQYCDPPYRWRREIGIEYPEKYDGVWEWQCPDCKGIWPSVVARLKNEGEI